MLIKIIALVANDLIIIPIIACVALWLWLPAGAARRRYLIVTLVSGVVALSIATLLGHLINDPRPFVIGHFRPLIHHAADNGFPSDHTLLVATLGFAALPSLWWFGVSLVAMALLIGGARVAAGVHHWEDVIGSIVIALVSVGLVLLVDRLIITRRGKTA